MTETLRCFLAAATKTEEEHCVSVKVNETKKWSTDGLFLVFKSTCSGLAWPPFSASLIYHKWNALTLRLV